MRVAGESRVTVRLPSLTPPTTECGQVNMGSLAEDELRRIVSLPQFGLGVIYNASTASNQTK